MKMNVRQRWKKTWGLLADYVWPENRDRTLRERVLVLLEMAQRLFTRPSGTQSKKRRLFRRWLPSLACLVIGCFLFLPAHQVAQAQATVATQANVPAQSSQPAKSTLPTSGKNPADDSTCPTDNLDKLTGLPLSTTVAGSSDNNVCAVQISNTCSMQATNGYGVPEGNGNWPVTLLLTYSTVPGFYQDWLYILGIALALLAVPFVLAGYQIMLGTTSTHYAGAIEILSRVVLVALLAGLSYTLILLIIQLEYNLVLALSYKIPPDKLQVVVPASQWCVNAQNFFGNLFNLNSYNQLNLINALNNTGTDYTSQLYSTTLSLINNLTTDVLTLLSVVLTAQLLIRLALLNFYIILSPLAILCGTLPGETGPGAARAWIKGLLALLFVQLLQLLAYLLGSRLFPVSLLAGSGWFNQVLVKLLPIVIMLIILNIPRLFNVSATNQLSTVSSSIGGSMTNVVLIVRGF